MKFIIFDIDGTLTDTKKVDDQCFIDAFRQTFNLDITNQNWGELKHVTDWGITEEIIQREWNRVPKTEEYKTMKSNLIANLKIERQKDSNQFQEVEGARMFFDDLKSIDEFSLGVATGAWEESAMIKLESARISLADVCFSNSSRYKSREDIVADVIEQLKDKNNTRPEKIFYFGDGVWDYTCCQHLGIEFIGIDILHDGKLSAAGAEHMFNNFKNCDVIMDTLNNK